MANRSDFRLENDLREVRIDLGVIKEADGSAKVSHGRTSAFAAVYGPIQAKYTRQEDYAKATVEIDLKWPTVVMTAGSNSDQVRIEKSISNNIKKVVESAIDLTLFPRLVILVKVTVVVDDGAALATAINASILALVNSGISMLCTPTSLTMVMSQDGRQLVDPTAEEEAAATSVLSFAVSSSSAKQHAAARQEAEESGMEVSSELRVVPAIVWSHSVGVFDVEVLKAAMSTALAGTAVIADLMRQAISSP